MQTVDKSQLRAIAQELVAPVLAEIAAEMAKSRDVVEASRNEIKTALQALTEERARVGVWRQRIEAEAKGIRVDLNDFRQRVSQAEAEGQLRDKAQDKALKEFSETLAKLSAEVIAALSIAQIERKTLKQAEDQLEAKINAMEISLQQQRTEAIEELERRKARALEQVSSSANRVQDAAEASRRGMQKAKTDAETAAAGAKKVVSAVSERLFSLEARFDGFDKAVATMIGRKNG